MLRKWLAVALCGLVLSACGGGGGGGSPTPQETAAKFNSYLPTGGGIKLYYDYNTTPTYFSDPKYISGTRTEVLTHPTGAKEYLTIDESSIAFRGVYIPFIETLDFGTYTADIVLDQNIVLWSENMQAGRVDIISGGGTANINPTYGSVPIGFVATAYYDGKETVTVPYGTFEAINVRLSLSVGITIQGYAMEIPLESEIWLVDGIGIVKRVESGTPVVLTDFSGADSDGDGVMDAIDPFPNDANESKDSDKDGIGDNADTDDDNDGVPDLEDAFPYDSTESKDSDGDGIGDNKDTINSIDSDGDGVYDDVDAFPNDPNESVDTDADGIGDNSDIDIDGDGHNNDADAFPYDKSEWLDTDGDGIGDNADPVNNLDTDGDGVYDDLDAFPTDPSESVDTDADGIGDNSDIDIDGDGHINEADAFPYNANEWLDTDGDGTGDNSDNNDDNDSALDSFDAFPKDPTETTDTDSDGIGNNADLDDDNDGVLDENDAFPLDSSETADFDGDGIGDNADADDDNDGTPDSIDAFPHDSTETTDTDHDGIGNNTDTDDDNDGVLDENDAFPLDSSETADFDNDNIGDNADTDDDNDEFADDIDLYPYDALHNEALSADPNILTFNTVLGTSVDIASQPIHVNGNNLDWTINTASSWIVPDMTEGYSDGTFNVDIDPTGLSSGTHEGSITLESSFSGEVVTINVTLNIVLPTLTLSETDLEFNDTIDSLVFDIELNTGTNSYNWTAAITDGDGAALNFDNSGSVNGSTHSVYMNSFGPDGVSGLSEGRHSSTITYSVDVLGETVTQSIDAHLMTNIHRLHVSDNGIAFSQFPSSSILSKTVTIEDSYRLVDTPWTAESNQSWLTVTASGTTSDTLTLTANPDGLSTDTLHTAEITISSSNTAVETTEVIYVGLWVGSTNPAPHESVATSATEITADPIRPYVYAHETGASNITIYNIYQRTVVGTINGLGTNLGDMEVSSDGQTLFVVDNDAPAIVKVNLNDYSSTRFTINQSLPTGFTLARNKGQSLLFTEHGLIYNTDTGEAVKDSENPGNTLNFSTTSRPQAVDASLHGTVFCNMTVGVSPITVTCNHFAFSSYDNSIKLYSHGSYTDLSAGNGRDIAINSEGSLAYVAAGGSYDFIRFSIHGMTGGSTLSGSAYPNAIEIGDDDSVHGGASVSSGTTDLWVYEPVNLRTSAYVSGSGKNILARQIAVSGDGRMTMISSADTAKTDPKLSFISSY